MSARTPRIPSYRRHKPSGQAVVTIAGKDHYLGPYGSAESRKKYARLIAEWSAGGSQAVREQEPTVNMVVAPYLRHVNRYYQKDGEPTSQVILITLALKTLRRLYGSSPAREFGPLALKACREEFVKQGLARTEVNRRTGLVKQLFRWATENELVPSSVYHGLIAVAGLPKGRTDAPVRESVGPVADQDVEKVLPFLTSTIRAMVLLQWYSGMRPAEVCRLRTCDLVMNSQTWEYRPERHKNQHHDKARVVYLGPKCQEVLRPFLTTDLTAYLFRPAASISEREAEQRIDGKSRARKGKPARPKRRKLSPFYRTNEYRTAIRRACQRAGVPPWSPNQLRHSLATKLRSQHGLEAARVVLGHTVVRTTQHY